MNMIELLLPQQTTAAEGSVHVLSTLLGDFQSLIFVRTSFHNDDNRDPPGGHAFVSSVLQESSYICNTFDSCHIWS